MNRIILLSALALAYACSNDTDALEKPDAGTTADDSGTIADTGVLPDDAGTPDMGVVPPARTLVENRLLGDSPLDNLVISPNMDLFATAWFSFTLDGQSYADAARYHLRGTPTKQPALGVQPAAAGVAVMGTVRSSPSALAASVWVGLAGKRDERFTAQISLLGTDTTGGDVAFDLVPDESTRTVSGEYVWIRYWGMVPEGPVGFAQLYVQELEDKKIFLTGPVVVPMAQSRLTPSRLPPRRTLRAGERLGLAELVRREKERLGRSPLTPTR